MTDHRAHYESLKAQAAEADRIAEARIAREQSNAWAMNLEKAIPIEKWSRA